MRKRSRILSFAVKNTVDSRFRGNDRCVVRAGRIVADTVDSEQFAVNREQSAMVWVAGCILLAVDFWQINWLREISHVRSR